MPGLFLVIGRVTQWKWWQAFAPGFYPVLTQWDSILHHLMKQFLVLLFVAWVV